tara:strand:- start:214 stop:534 length:321 start_codon:yes stop_codon:yes gene_type:complete
MLGIFKKIDTHIDVITTLYNYKTLKDTKQIRFDVRVQTTDRNKVIKSITQVVKQWLKDNKLNRLYGIEKLSLCLDIEPLTEKQVNKFAWLLIVHRGKFYNVDTHYS